VLVRGKLLLKGEKFLFQSKRVEEKTQEARHFKHHCKGNSVYLRQEERKLPGKGGEGTGILAGRIHHYPTSIVWFHKIP